MSPQEPPTLPPSQPGASGHDSAKEIDPSAGLNDETRAPETAKPGVGKSAVAPGLVAEKGSGGEDLIDLGEDPAATMAIPKDAGASGSSSKAADTHDHPGLTDDSLDPMMSSVATLKPNKTLLADTSAQFLTPEPGSYVDPTPPTPFTSQPPSRSPSNARSRYSGAPSEPSPTRSDAAYDEKRYMSEDDQEGGSRSEIQSIMEQFGEDGGGPGAEEVMSPRLEIASPMLSTPIQHPPRKSSLEPLAPSISGSIHELQGLRITSSSPVSIRSQQKTSEDQGPPVPPKDGPSPAGTPSRIQSEGLAVTESPMSPSMGLHRPPPPEPEPEPALPFDFHRFLEQLRNKKADPVARYLKSFLQEFAKRQWMVHEQVKIISDFLAFIANKMEQCDVWRDVSDAEFDNAREGMEKLVMNRLYTQTFSPAIPAPQPIPGAKPKRRGGERPLGPGRRGQHQEDVERDDILTQKINIYGWVKEEHLDIPPVSDSGRRFLKLAQQGSFLCSFQALHPC
jgi:Rab5 GDP/GTP exchange factor